MTKKETADFLGMTVKSLENHMAKKRIAFAHVKIKGVTQVEFNQEEVERFKEELGKKDKVSFPAIAPGVTELTPANPTLATINNEGIISNANELITTIKNLTKELTQQNQQNNNDLLGIKLTLSLVEAAQVSGLSTNFLKKAIKDGELKAAKRGKGWNIKRTDLEMWVEGL